MSLEVNIKSVNGRYLDVRIYSPKVYSSLDLEIKKRVSKYLQRGTVEINLNRHVQSSAEMSFDESLAKKWLQGLNRAAKSAGLPQVQNPEILLQIPDFFQVREDHSLKPQEKKKFFEVLDEALKKISEARQREGSSLRKVVLGHLQDLEGQVGQIQKLRAKILPELQKKFQDRLSKISELSLEPQRLTQEVALLLDRGDITEELERLKAHLAALKEIIKSNESQGKKLDFYAQELLREINTIGSKSQQAALTKCVVEAKSHIEKYREQVQNIE